jgi:AcrR family transcriptional regulator
MAIMLSQKAVNSPTKEKIFYSAAALFSQHGFSEVSMRDIGQAVGINVSSLYNHYSSKKDILKAHYDYYTYHWEKSCPDLHELLYLAESIPPKELLMKLDFRFDPAVQEVMDHILKTAIREMRADTFSEEFVRNHILERLAPPMFQVLNRLIELGRIEPINVSAMVRLLTNFSLSAALFNYTSVQMSLEDWQDVLQLVFSLIKEI